MDSTDLHKQIKALEGERDRLYKREVDLMDIEHDLRAVIEAMKKVINAIPSTEEVPLPLAHALLDLKRTIEGDT